MTNGVAESFYNQWNDRTGLPQSLSGDGQTTLHKTSTPIYLVDTSCILQMYYNPDTHDLAWQTIALQQVNCFVYC